MMSNRYIRMIEKNATVLHEMRFIYLYENTKINVIDDILLKNI